MVLLNRNIEKMNGINLKKTPVKVTFNSLRIGIGNDVTAKTTFTVTHNLYGTI